MVDGGGSVGEVDGGKNNGLRRVWEWTPVRAGAGGTTKTCTSVQSRREHGTSKMWVVWP